MQSPSHKWFKSQKWKPFPFQEEAWDAYRDGWSGLVNAPTGSGKTYSLLLPILEEGLEEKRPTGLRALWIAPIRALTKEISTTAEKAAEGLGSKFRIGVRTGDTSTAAKTKMKKSPPQIMITTPESVHLMLAQKGYADYFKQLNCVVIDEWHELMGSKRGVLMELALSRLKAIRPELKVWGISATIGNMDDAVRVLHGSTAEEKPLKVIRANIKKGVDIISLMPDNVDELPWAGHLGIKMIEKVLPVLIGEKSTLVFTNTRSQTEIWYQRFLDVAPELSGLIAMHHGSISREIRDWVEQALHDEKIKAVVATGSLDLGVDFRPVDTVIQIGGPKGVARFLQRAGRSNHKPGETSIIYFVPTHSLELIEAAAIREAHQIDLLENREPYIRSFDVLIQYLVTLAVSDGYRPEELFHEIKSTHCYESISEDEWQWCLNFITYGGDSLKGYNEFHKVVIQEGVFKVINRRTAMRHRMSMGTIVGGVSMSIKWESGGRIGTVEEYFITKIKIGQTFWFAGRSLELVKIKDTSVIVKKSNKKSGVIPSWQGGRMPLSLQMSKMLRKKLGEALDPNATDPEMKVLQPLLQIQADRSLIPNEDQFLIEYFESEEGHHLVFFPFEGRLAHEGLAALFAWRIAQQRPVTFSMAMNDYGFELLSDQRIVLTPEEVRKLSTTDNLYQDIQSSINAAEMARRAFRDISQISGLVFNGFPGKEKKARHIQASSGLFYKVFEDYEPDNLLLRQAFDEVYTFQLEENRMRAALDRIARQEIVINAPQKYTPLAFPIMVDRLNRDKLSTEKLEDRVKRMQLEIG